MSGTKNSSDGVIGIERLLFTQSPLRLRFEYKSTRGSTGTPEVGKFADVVAAPGDPIADIAALQSVRFATKRGVIVLNTDRRL